MNIVKRIDQYNSNYISFCEPIKNNIIDDSNFIRIFYSTPYIIFNGVYLLIELNDVIFEKHYNKYKCVFDITNNLTLIEKIRSIEEEILKKYELRQKNPQYKIYEQIRNGNIKIFGDHLKIYNHSNHLFILKISGIWETNISYGLTYKFIKINHL